ncbi:MAG: S-methyl-5-thioribose-1-phosphate isomerase [Acidimicrobiia bacterium]|nr:S-methyl-5-thioribose-1-phosphate isomerase [Acidimicrobiia bacterium]
MTVPPTVQWNSDTCTVDLIDQRLLPATCHVVTIDTLHGLCEAIQTLAVRGAPALEIAGAAGMALAAYNDAEPNDAYEMIVSTRPTAVNLEVGARRALEVWQREGRAAVSDVALSVFDEDASRNRAIATRGAAILRTIAEELGGSLNVITHCNAGRLACGDVGTALGIIEEAWRGGVVDEVFVNETRPLMQGARLTAWELEQEEIPHAIIPDSAAAFILESEGAGAAVVGADRIAANGDVANKIGTFNLAIVARYFEIPFIVAAPESTIDMRTPEGADIPIEMRDERELLDSEGWPEGQGHALNPAFDITPSELVTHTVTETRTISQGHPPGRKG